MTKRDSQSDLERKIHMVAKNEIGLTDDERQELAAYLLRRDITSWSQLEPHQVCRVADALEGYQLISALLLLRSPAPEDEQLLSNEPGDASTPPAPVRPSGEARHDPEYPRHRAPHAAGR